MVTDVAVHSLVATPTVVLFSPRDVLAVSKVGWDEGGCTYFCVIIIKTMTNNDMVIVRCSVATSCSAMWHLGPEVFIVHLQFLLRSAELGPPLMDFRGGIPILMAGGLGQSSAGLRHRGELAIWPMGT
jgi:hypothetical protein